PRTRLGTRTRSPNPRPSTPTPPSPNPSRPRANMNISARYIRAWLERSSSNPPGNHRDRRPNLAQPAIEDPNAIQPMPRAKSLLTTMTGRTLWSHRKTRPTWTCSSLTGLPLTPRRCRRRHVALRTRWHRAYGLARCTWRGLDHFKTYIWSVVVTHNLVLVARLKPA